MTLNALANSPKYVGTNITDLMLTIYMFVMRNFEKSVYIFSILIDFERDNYFVFLGGGRGQNRLHPNFVLIMSSGSALKVFGGWWSCK